MKPKAENVYKVKHLVNNTYQVYEKIRITGYGHIEEIDGMNNDVLFQGTLPECESFINLKEKGCV